MARSVPSAPAKASSRPSPAQVAPPPARAAGLRGIDASGTGWQVFTLPPVKEATAAAAAKQGEVPTGDFDFDYNARP